jgi:hypothetical protein
VVIDGPLSHGDLPEKPVAENAVSRDLDGSAGGFDLRDALKSWFPKIAFLERLAVCTVEGSPAGIVLKESVGS